MKHKHSFPNWKWLLPLVTTFFLIALQTAIAAQVDALDSSASVAAAAAVTSYVVVDTGQIKCYNATTEISCPSSGAAFYGQDAQFSRNAPGYTLSGDGLTVYDNNTGLTWQRSPDTNGDGSITYSDKLTWAQAQAVPATLNAANYGGYSDWRLPSIKELYSLIDFSGTDTPPSATTGTTPFIDTDYFGFSYGFISEGERIIDSQWVSTALYVANTSQMFGVNFADGRIKGYPTSDSIAKKYHVLCVRGNASYGVNNFADNGDGTVTDNATGLMWSQADSGSGMNWQSALAWVQTKNSENYLGHNDWRLPNAKELQSIVDYTRSPNTTGSAAIDPIFTSTQITNELNQADFPFYWTGTTLASAGSPPAGRPGEGVYVAFGRALGNMNGTWIDIHGAGAQRSDPKDGNPADYPYGRGPQGDAVRIYNYVRLVRTASTTTSPTATPTVTPTPSPTATPTRTPTPGVCYDFDHNGQVDALDIAAVASRWSNAALYDPTYDMAAPIGEIDVIDIMTVAAHWGLTC